MSFRMLADEELFGVAHQIMVTRHSRGILEFVRDIWGDEAYQVLIQDDGDTYDGPVIDSIEVTDKESNEILPDFTLPYWKEILEEDPEFFDGCDTPLLQLRVVNQQIRDDELYSQYTLSVDDAGEVIVLSELTQYQYPELYRKE